MSVSPGQDRASDAPEWRAQPPPDAWDRMRAGESRRRQPLLAVTGALATGLGVIALLVPAVASVGMSVFVGIILMAASVAVVLHALASEGAGHRLLRGLAALATFAAGLYLLLAPEEGAIGLTAVLAIWLCGFGIVQVFTGTRVAGAGSIAFGVLIAVRLPSSADWAIGLLVGLDLIVFGGLCLARALRT